MNIEAHLSWKTMKPTARRNKSKIPNSQPFSKFAELDLIKFWCFILIT